MTDKKTFLLTLSSQTVKKSKRSFILKKFICFSFLNVWTFKDTVCLLCFRGFTGGGKTEELKQEKDDVINIFSVASGHLYERFLRWVADICPHQAKKRDCLINQTPWMLCVQRLYWFQCLCSPITVATSLFYSTSPLRIMMLSVLKNTKTPVKFWFLKNYLSPTFKVGFFCFHWLL